MHQNSGPTAVIPSWFKLLTAALVALRILGFNAQNQEHKSGINWQKPIEPKVTDDITTSPYLFEFSADWCKPCKQLEEKVFTNAEVIKLINDQFIPVRLQDRQKEDGKNSPVVASLESRYRVFGFPTLIVALPNGELISQNVGVPSSFDVHTWLLNALKLANYNRGLLQLIAADPQRAHASFQKVLTKPDWTSSKAKYAAAFLFVCQELVSGPMNKSRPQDTPEGKLVVDASSTTLIPWPGPILKYLAGDMTTEQLLASTHEEQDELTEARCFIALDLLAAKKTEEAIQNFQWIKDHGNHDYQTYKIAVVFLERLTEEKKSESTQSK
jgi:thioredoxin-like negative regulator of GroEL